MDENKVITLYVQEKMTLRMIAEIMNTDHHTIKRILEKNGVEITRKGRIRKPFSDEHRKRLSESCKGKEGIWKGKKVTKVMLYKNMLAHLRYNITLEWIMQFEDIERLKYLNRSISRSRDCEGFTTEIYIKFIEKFYFDNKFNKLFTMWIETGDKWIKPSLDHIVPKSKNGPLKDINNLQFISWFENRAKVDIPLEQWEKIKRNINDYL